MDVQLEISKLTDLAGQLRAMRTKLDQYNALMRQYPVVSTAIGRDVSKQEAAYGDLVSMYQQVRVAVGFDVAPGLGIAPIIWVGIGVAALVAAIITSIAMWWNYEKDVLGPKAAAALQAEQNRASILATLPEIQKQIEVAQQKGNFAEVERLKKEYAERLRQAGSPGAVPQAPPQSFGEWVQQNWVSLALAFGLIYIGPSVVESFSD